MKLRFYMRGLGIGIIITALILGIHFRGQSNGMTDEQVIERAKELGMEEKYQSGTLAEMKDEQDKAGKADDGSKKTDTAIAGDEDGRADAAAAEGASSKNQDETAEASKTQDEAAEASKPQNETAEAEKPLDETAEAEKPQDETAEAEKPQDETAEAGKASDEAASNKESDNSDDGAQKADNVEAGKTSDKAEDDQVDITKKRVFVISGGQGSDTIASNLAKAGIIKDAAAFDEFLCARGYDKKLRAGEHVIPAGADDEAIASELMRSP